MVCVLGAGSQGDGFEEVRCSLGVQARLVFPGARRLFPLLGLGLQPYPYFCPLWPPLVSPDDLLAYCRVSIHPSAHFKWESRSCLLRDPTTILHSPDAIPASTLTPTPQATDSVRKDIHTGTERGTLSLQGSKLSACLRSGFLIFPTHLTPIKGGYRVLSRSGTGFAPSGPSEPMTGSSVASLKA